MRKAFLIFLLSIFCVPAAIAQKSETRSESFTGGGQVIFYGGATAVQFSGDFAAAMEALNINVQRTSLARNTRGIEEFLITDGIADVDTLRGEIVHSGGLILSRGNTSVRLQSFIIDTTGESIVLSGVVSVNGSVLARVPLFDLTLPTPEAGTAVPSNVLVLENVFVGLSATAAGALNAVFETNAFVPGFNVGTASVQGFFLGI